MTASALPPFAHRAWSRRWVRRLTYLLASGTVLVGIAGIVAGRPGTDRWILGQLNPYVKRETGLDFTAERLDVHPFQGRILLHDLTLGGDLFQADLLEVDLEWRSLLHQPHIRLVRLVNPSLRVDRGHLAALHLREHAPAKSSPKVRLDRLEIVGGHAVVVEPAWGVPPGEYFFQVDGRGRAANQLKLNLQIPRMAVGAGKARLQGALTLKGELSDTRLLVDQGQVRLGSNTLSVAGSYAFATRNLKATATQASVDLAQVLALALPGQPPAASGTVTFTGQAEGPLTLLHWKALLAGRELKAQGLPLHPGTLQLAASGRPRELSLENLTWTSQDGKLTAQGGWTRNAGTRLEVQGDGVDLSPLVKYARSGSLQDLTARFHGEASLPGAPWENPRLDLLAFKGDGQLLQDGARVGGLVFTLGASKFHLSDLHLDLPEGELHATATATLTRHGLDRFEGEGEIHTDAQEVAEVLKDWDIGMSGAAGQRQAFDMAGLTQASARFGWDAREGFRLTGLAQVQQPRWHGARADTLSAQVTLDRFGLQASDILLEKGAGRGYGDMHLAWANMAPGTENMDMCYRFFRLPIHEGLKAADQGDLAIKGTGSGWVRLHGPFDHILMEGAGVAEQGEVYGLRIPAASADFAMDLTTLRLQASDARVADTLEHLRSATPGTLDLTGAMDMDIQHGRWTATIQGDADSQLLGLPGPRLQAHVDGHLDGPVTAPLGPYQLPTGALALSKGRLSQGTQSMGGLEAALLFRGGHVLLQAGLEGMPARILELDAHQVAPQKLAGTLRLNLGPDSANTAKLAKELSQDFLKDAQAHYQAHGSWGAEGLAFTGTLDQLLGQFEGFHLAQGRPGRIDGNGSGVSLNLELQGRNAEPPPKVGAPAPPAAPVTTLELEGRLPFSPSGNLALELSGSAEMASLKTVLDHVLHPGQYSLLADMHPGGTARVNLHLGGTPADATLDGTLNVMDGRVSVSTFPQSIENVDFTAHFQGRDVFITEADPLRGTLAQGPLKLWGRATWQVNAPSTYDLHATLDDFQFRDIPEGLEVLGSLDATFRGNDQDGCLLQGSIQAKRVDYHADINLSDLMLASASGSTPGLGALDPSDPLARVDLDLDIHLAEPWEVDTNILKLQGRPHGAFKIMGSLAAPGLKGKMEFLPGGRITSLLPTDVVLEQGSVEFKDPSAFNPNIDLQGRVDVPPYLVMLGLTGTLDHLQVSASSTPSLRQEEIVAILIDPDAAATVGASAAYSSQGLLTTGLASTGTGLISSLALANFQEGLRKTLSLDRVNVAIRSSMGTSDTEVTIGKSYQMFGYRIPVVLIHRKEADVTTVSGQLELRLGSFVLQMGGSQTTGTSLSPSGEIRHSWSPK